MKSLRNFTINTRLIAGFLAVLALMGAGALVGIWQLGKLEEVVDRVANEEAIKLSHAERWMRGIAVNLVRAKVSLVATDEDELLAQFKAEMEATSKEITEHEKAIEAMVKGGEGRKLLERIAVDREKYRTLRASLLKRRTAGEDVRETVAREMNPAADVYYRGVREFVEWQHAQVDVVEKSASEAASVGRSLVIAALVLGLVAGIIIAFLISRSVVGPLAVARDHALRIAKGDLHDDITVEGRDEAAQLLKAISEMQASLKAIVREVHSSAEMVTTASTQIASGNADLSARTEEQASSIEETAASIEELTSTVGQNADNAREADQLASGASRIANRGGEVVNEVVRKMEEIQASSKKISEIIGVIDGIAFQTNILALNAAVEAARAGEQGRGFAVVASEVRNLAQRSASAAKEIKGLITDSVGTVDAGSKLVDEAGKTMEEVVNSVQRVSEIIGQIASATHEQSSGIGQVNTAVTELDRVTQQNAALVEESAAASESLNSQALRLAQSVAVFKVSNTHDAITLAAPAKAPVLSAPRASKPLPAPAKSAATAPKARTQHAPQPAGTDAGSDDDWKQF